MKETNGYRQNFISKYITIHQSDRQTPPTPPRPGGGPTNLLDWDFWAITDMDWAKEFLYNNPARHTAPAARPAPRRTTHAPRDKHLLSYLQYGRRSIDLTKLTLDLLLIFLFPPPSK